MAAKSTKGKKNTKSTTKKTQQKSGQSQNRDEIRGEIIILGLLAVCILLVLSNFGLGGIVGKTVSSVFFGIFGFMAYFLPFILFGAVAFGISNKGNSHAYIKLGAVAALFLILCGMIELLFHPYDKNATLFSYYVASSEHKNAGGFAGGCLIRLFCPLFGKIGAGVILVVLGIISIILITERSLLSPIGRKSKVAYEEAKRKRQETAVIRTKERERKERERQTAQETEESGAGVPGGKEKKARGVSFATTLLHGEGEEKVLRERKSRRRRKSPEIQELTPEGTVPDGGDSEESDPGRFVINRAEPLTAEETEMTGTERSAEEGVPDAMQMPSDPQEMPARRNRKNTKENAQAVAAETASVEQSVRAMEEQPQKIYRIPPMNLLVKGKKGGGDSDAHLRATALKLEQTLQNFGVGVHVTNASCGPSVTRYELQPEQGVKVSKIVGLADDIKLNLAVADLRIEAPIPGKAAVGIEVPNSENTAVMLRDLLESDEFKNSRSPISFAVGKDIAGKVVVADIAKMPHLLVAGATGSGKSVCINTLIMSIIYKADPEDVKLILVDPKVVELSVYNGIPHLMIPVVTDPKKAAGALNWAVAEMEKRYKLFAEYNVRDLKGFNEKVLRGETGEDAKKKLPQIIIIIDELADLMMVAPGEVEGAICRLAQLARAAGLHLILATQRPSVNVITGLIKANMPSRIAFSVSSGVDSRTIIDMNGAEKLLGKGDMLFYPSGYPKPVRVQGSFVSDKEVQKVVDYLIDKNGSTAYSNELEEHMMTADVPTSISGVSAEDTDDRDVYFTEAGQLIIDKDRASIGMLQRMFKIGFNRAARIMDQLAEAGVVGPEEGTKPRKVLMSKEEFDAYIAENK
ncbi:FtsK/SpoIIIE family DNA translocase [[Ruminococcus] lactaris]|uniref:DNA translocase FtsK n=1 Tax=[Ruminococcus] lactaris TaxID=46228 RepID=A0A415D4P5_9FIRM|nr:DNA translocase FtsK [[Ruminococcus] lactaris]RHJ61113.1 DNA translocase FtsK [[Ruminococcus] lactaris]